MKITYQSSDPVTDTTNRHYFQRDIIGTNFHINQGLEF